jgi:hypothetical protein
MSLPPRWITNAGLVWSTILEHHDRYVLARQDADRLPDTIKGKQKVVQGHEDDLVALGNALNGTPSDTVIKLRYDDKKNLRDRFRSEIAGHHGRMSQAQKTLDHFEHRKIEQAWVTLFVEEMPTTAPESTWDDGDGQNYLLFPRQRIVTRGKYDGILISDDQQPLV